VKSSWRTTLWGVVAILASAVVVADFGPLATKIAGCIGSAASGIGLLLAKDSKETKTPPS
jgi:hypothetical protein